MGYPSAAEYDLYMGRTLFWALQICDVGQMPAKMSVRDHKKHHGRVSEESEKGFVRRVKNKRKCYHQDPI